MKTILLQQQSGRGVAPPAPSGDAWQWWSAETISAILGSPVENVRANWPLIFLALESRGIADRATQIAALATIGVEDSAFVPIEEYGGGYEYEGRADLGNTQPGDGHRYMGRSYLQLTGRSNYRAYGEALGIDLEGNPDLAMDPEIGAKIFALYFTDHLIRWLAAPAPLMNVADLARAGEWRGCRIAVNGGLNGYDQFMTYVNALQAAT